MTPIVIPLSPNGGKFGDHRELRFSLRSLERHYQGDLQVVVVGAEVPAWIQGVVHLQATQGDLQPGLMTAAHAYPNGFYWFDANHCLLHDVSPTTLRPAPVLPADQTGTSWKRMVVEMRNRWLKHEGFSRPSGDMCGPRWLDESLVDAAFESPHPATRNNPNPRTLIRHYRGPFKNPPKSHHTHLSYDDEGDTPELREWLAHRFAEPSRFEKPLREICTDTRLRGVMIGLSARPRWENDCIKEMAEIGIDLDHFEGIDGHHGMPLVMPVNREAFHRNFNREPLPSEMGCYASHVHFARQAAAMPALSPEFPEWRLMFEDDAVPVDMNAHTLARIAALAETDGYDVVMLHTGRRNSRGSDPLRLSPNHGKDVRTHAYLANQRALSEISGWEMQHPIDHAIMRSSKLRVGLLWGRSRFVQRSSAVSIRHERKAQRARYGSNKIVRSNTGAYTRMHPVWSMCLRGIRLIPLRGRPPRDHRHDGVK